MNKAETLRINRYRWMIFWILASGYVLVYFHRLCPAVVAVDMMRDLQTGGTLTGLLAAAYFYPYALMQLPSGLLTDSWGPRRTITLFFGVACIGAVMLGLAPTAGWAILGRTLVGLGAAMLFVPTLKILAEWFKPHEFAGMTGILMAMGGLGSLASAAPLAWINRMIGWRLSFMLVGLLTLLLSGLVWWLVRDHPSAKGWAPLPAPVSAANNRRRLRQNIQAVVTNPHFWILAIWFFFNCAVFYSFAGIWGGPYMIQIHGLHPLHSGRILSLVAAGTIVGSPVLSYLSSRVFCARKPILRFCTGVLVAITALLAFATAQLPVFSLYLICLGLGICASAVTVIAFTANKELFPIKMAGTASGLLNFFPFAGGAVFQPLTGFLLERQGLHGEMFTLAGYQSAFRLLFICALIDFIASFFIRETLPKPA